MKPTRKQRKHELLVNYYVYLRLAARVRREKVLQQRGRAAI